MGAALAKAAYAAAGKAGIDHAPKGIFVFMALVPRDDDPAPAYFGGADALAVEALGRPADESGLRAVRRAVHTLRDAGLVDRRSRGRGRTSRFLLLDGCGRPLMGGRSASGQEARWADAQRPVKKSMTGRSVVDDRTLSAVWADAQRPREEQEEIEEETRASAPPARNCRRHPSWEHSEPCRACASDRRAAETQNLSRPPTTMSERRRDCGTGNHRRMPDGTCLFCEDRDPLGEIA